MHYTGLEFQGSTNTTATFAQGAEEEKKEARLPPNSIQKTSNPKEKWPMAKNRPEEETEQSTDSKIEAQLIP